MSARSSGSGLVQPGIRSRLRAIYPYSFHHSWSIAVEEQFYLLFPIYLLAFKRHLRWALGFIVLLIPVAVLFRFNGAFRCLLVYRMDALCIGVTIAFYWAWSRSNDVRLGRLPVILIGFAGGALIASEQYLWSVSQNVGRAFYFLGYNLVFGAILLALVDQWSTRLNLAVSSRFMVFFGSISYALYLMHIPVRDALLHIFDEKNISDCHLSVQFAYFALSISAAYMSRLLVENKFERLKYRFPTSIPSDANGVKPGKG